MQKDSKNRQPSSKAHRQPQSERFENLELLLNGDEESAPPYSTQEFSSALEMVLRTVQVILSLILLASLVSAHYKVMHSAPWFIIAALTSVEKTIFGLRVAAGSATRRISHTINSDLSMILFWTLFACSLTHGSPSCVIRTFADAQFSSNDCSGIVSTSPIFAWIRQASVMLVISISLSLLNEGYKSLDSKPAIKLEEFLLKSEKSSLNASTSGASGNDRINRFAKSLAHALLVVSNLAGLWLILSGPASLHQFYPHQTANAAQVLLSAALVSLVSSSHILSDSTLFVGVCKLVGTALLIFWMSFAVSFDELLMAAGEEYSGMLFSIVAMSNVALYYLSILWFDD